LPFCKSSIQPASIYVFGAASLRVCEFIHEKILFAEIKKPTLQTAMVGNIGLLCNETPGLAGDSLSGHPKFFGTRTYAAAGNRARAAVAAQTIAAFMSSSDTLRSSIFSARKPSNTARTRSSLVKA